MLATVDDRIGQVRRGLHPDRNGGGGTGLPLERFTCGDLNSVAAEEKNTRTDEGALGRRRRGETGVLFARIVTSGCSPLGEVINEHGGIGIGRGGIARGLGGGVPVVDPGAGRLGSLDDFGKTQPKESLVHERVVALEVERDLRLLVIGDDAHIAAVFLRHCKREVPLVEAYENHRTTLGTTAIGDFYIDGLAGGPGFVPPGGLFSLFRPFGPFGLCRVNRGRNDGEKQEHAREAEAA